MDTPLLWDLWLRPPSSEDLAQIMRRHPITFSPKVLKEPTTTFFPQACLKQTLRKRHVLIVRDPASNIRSAMDRFQLPGDGSIPAHSTLRPAYREFMDQTRSTPPLALAERWVLAYDQRIWLDPDIAVFPYEDFVATPHRVIEKAANHLGWDIVADFDFAIKAEHQPAGKNRATPVLEFFGPSTLEQIKLRTQGPYERLMNRAR